MRFLIVIAYSGLGGAEKQAISLALQMKEHQDEVKVLCLNSSKDKATELMDLLQIEYLTLKRNYNHRFLHYLKIFDLYKVIKEYSPDFVLTYTWYANIYAAIISQCFSKVCFIWGQRDEGFGIKPNIILKSYVYSFDYYIANSNGGVKFLKEVLKIPSNKIGLVYNGVSLPMLPLKKTNIYKTKYGISPNVFIATMVANLHSKKDHLTLIHAWAEFVKEPLFSNSILFLAGYFGDTAQRLFDLTIELGLEKNIYFLGAINDINALLSEANLLIMSSHSEGFSNAILEAMAIGLPVLATDILGNVEVLGDQTSSVTLFKVGDVKDMCSKLKILASNLKLCDKIGLYNRRRVEQLFSMRELYNNTIEIINNLHKDF